MKKEDIKYNKKKNVDVIALGKEMLQMRKQFERFKSSCYENPGQMASFVLSLF